MIKVGIIGFGYMGHFHLNKIKHFDQVKVVGVFDTDKEKLKEAEENQLEIYRTLEDFLKTDIDLAVIAIPNQWHEMYAVACLRAGKNVMCEKPAALSVQEVEHIKKCCDETGRFFTVHQQRRWDADYRAVCEVIRSGEIGNVTTIESRVLGERGVCFGWRADPESGGGMLYDWGVHLIDQILQLYDTETVVSVYARVFSVLTPAVDDFFEIILMLSNGVCAKIAVGTFALQKLPRWFVFADRGTMKLDDFSAKTGGIARIKKEVRGFESVVGQKALGPSRTMAPLQPEFIENSHIPAQEDMEFEFWNNLIQAAEGKAGLHVTTDQIMRQMRVVEAAFASAEKNEVIKTNI